MFYRDVTPASNIDAFKSAFLAFPQEKQIPVSLINGEEQLELNEVISQDAVEYYPTWNEAVTGIIFAGLLHGGPDQLLMDELRDAWTIQSISTDTKKLLVNYVHHIFGYPKEDIRGIQVDLDTGVISVFKN